MTFRTFALAAGMICSANAATLSGAGATFPEPIYAKWILAFQSKDPDVQIHYQATGSEEGIRLLRAAKVDFAACDFPIDDSDHKSGGEPERLFPTVVGAVVPVYNIPGFLGNLRLTPQALAGIYLGRIKKWNDPAILASNHGARLPAAEIVVVHRSDGSGTSYIWSEYLSKVSPEWQRSIGRGSTLRWPLGETAQGNEGVASVVKQTANSIGYVEFIYGVRERLAIAAVQNAAGKFIQPDIPSISEAASTAAAANDFRVSITNPASASAYPIASFTWFVIPVHISDGAKRESLFKFLSWLLASGQRQAAALGYISLPEVLLARERAEVSRAQAAR